MDNQPKYLAQSESEFFADGKTMRHPPEHTVPRGAWLGDPAVTTGMTEADEPIAAIPIEVTDDLLVRGERQYGIYCGPCHGEDLDGDGMLNRRAQVETEDLLAAHSRQMPDGQLFDTISRGFGLMSGYAYVMPPRDRWAVVAFVRQRQREEPVSQPAEPAEDSQTDEESPDAGAEGTAPSTPASPPIPSKNSSGEAPRPGVSRSASPDRDGAAGGADPRASMGATAPRRASMGNGSVTGPAAADKLDVTGGSVTGPAAAEKLEVTDGSVTGPAAAIRDSAATEPTEAPR